MYGDGKTPAQEARDSTRMLLWAILSGLVSMVGGAVWLLR